MKDTTAKMAGIDSHVDTSVFDDDADDDADDSDPVPDKFVDKGLGLNEETIGPQVLPKEKGKNIFDLEEGIITHENPTGRSRMCSKQPSSKLAIKLYHRC